MSTEILVLIGILIAIIIVLGVINYRQSLENEALWKSLDVTYVSLGKTTQKLYNITKERDKLEIEIKYKNDGCQREDVRKE